MIIILGALLGAGLGVLQARRRGGGGLDVAQYAGSYALVFAILALALSVTLARLIG